MCPLGCNLGSFWLIRYWDNNQLAPISSPGQFNTLRPRRNEQHIADDIFKRIFLNENVWISIKISLKFVPKGLIINNIPALVSDNGLAPTRRQAIIWTNDD